MIRKFAGFIVLAFRYIVNVPTLCMSVLIRYRIGSDCYAPWSWLPHGEGDGCYRPQGWMRFWFILVSFLWIRLFMVITVATQSSGFDVGLWREWGSLFQGFWTLSHFNSDVYAQGSGSGFFYILSFAFVIAALLQLLIFEEILEGKGWRPLMYSLGRSILFIPLVKYSHRKFGEKGLKIRHAIRGTLEPLILGLIGGAFYVFDFPIHAWFFWISGIAMSFQAHFYRSKIRKENDELLIHVKERQKALASVEDLKTETPSSQEPIKKKVSKAPHKPLFPR